MSEKYSTDELLLAERILSRVDALSDPRNEQKRLGLREDESSDELLQWQRENSFYKCLDRVISHLHVVADAVRAKSVE
jgi:hypothetical protein